MNWTPEQLRTWAIALDVAPPEGRTELRNEIERRLAAVRSGSCGPRCDALVAMLEARLALLLRAEDQPEQAFEHALVAADQARRSRDPVALALSDLATGLILHHVGQLEEARRHLVQAGRYPDLPHAVRHHADRSAAAVLRALGRLDEAASVFDALVARDPHEGPQSRSALLINAASCWQQVGRLDDARAALADARTLASGSRPDLVAWADAIAAWTEARGGHPQLARELALRALDEAEHGIDLLGSAARALGQASLSLDPRARAEAQEHLERVLELALHRHARQEAVDLHGSLAALAQHREDLVAAVFHLRASHDLERELGADRERLRTQQEALRADLARMQLEAEGLRVRKAELERALEALVEADATRVRLMRTLAHDLRNPLTSVVVLVDLLDPAAPDFEQRRHQLRTAAGRMVDLLDGLLTERTPSHHAEVDLAELVRDSAATFSGLAERKQQRVLVETPEPVPCRTDAIAVRRIADNLMSNALKFSPPGSTVRIGVARGARSVALTVHDQGPGFPEIGRDEGMVYGAQLTSRAADEGGYGIGLNTVYQLASSLGGVVAVGNGEEGGALVRVQLPA